MTWGVEVQRKSSIAETMRRLLAAVCVFISATLCAADDEEGFVTCGSAIKLQHVASRFRLHSHEVAYGSGSGQQSVTGFADGDDSNSLWTVRPPLGGTCAQGSKITDGQLVRLQHVGTGRWLHSHNHRSPLSNQQEVSCYGENGASNTNDNWRVQTKDGAPVWERDTVVNFQHADTGVYLVITGRQFPRPIEGQREVAGAPRRGGDADFLAAEGVYFPPRKDAAHKRDEL
jgi:hypothetical protein